MVIEPIITLAMDPSFGPAVTPAGPSWALQFLQFFGIPAITINGQILPQTMILMMFAAWGVWHWILMAQNSMGAIKYHYEKLKEKMRQKKEAQS